MASVQVVRNLDVLPFWWGKVCGSDDLLENVSVWTTRVSWIGETTIDSHAFLHVPLVTQVASTFDQFDPMSCFWIFGWFSHHFNPDQWYVITHEVWIGLNRYDSSPTKGPKMINMVKRPDRTMKSFEIMTFSWWWISGIREYGFLQLLENQMRLFPAGGGGRRFFEDNEMENSENKKVAFLKLEEQKPLGSKRKLIYGLTGS